MWKVLSQIRKHPDVIPVFVITIIGAVFAGSAIVRTIVIHPEVSFRRTANPHPWLNVKTQQQTKFIHANNYAILKERPKYDD